MRKLLLCALAATALSGCTLMIKYVEPAGTDTAQLTFRPDMSDPSGFWEGFIYRDYKACKGVGTVFAEQPGNVPVTVRIPAGAPLTFTFETHAVVADKVRVCDQTVTFLPQPQRHYRVVQRNRSQWCTLALVEVPTHDNAGRSFLSPSSPTEEVPVPAMSRTARLKEFREGWTFSFCKPEEWVQP